MNTITAIVVRNTSSKADTSTALSPGGTLQAPAFPWSLSFSFQTPPKVVVFSVDGGASHTEDFAPWVVSGDDAALDLVPGPHSIAVKVDSDPVQLVHFTLAAPAGTAAKPTAPTATPPLPQTAGQPAIDQPAAAAMPAAPKHTATVTTGPIPALATMTTLLLERGQTYSTAGIFFDNLTDITLDACGDASKPLPVLMVTRGSNAFSFSAQSARIAIRNVRVDSEWMPASTVDGYAYHEPGGAFGNVRGTDITIDGVQLANLTEGIALAAVTRCTINNVAQVEPLGLPSRCLMIDDATDLIVTNCLFVNSINESPLRATGNGFTRAKFANNRISQLLDPSHNRATAKAAVTLRAGTDLTWTDNAVVDGELSINTDITGKQIITGGLMQGGSVTSSLLRIAAGARQITISEMTIDNQTGSECVADSSEATAGIIYDGLKLSGACCGIKSYGPGNFTYKNCAWTGSKTLPLVKGDLSAAVNGGGNQPN